MNLVQKLEGRILHEFPSVATIMEPAETANGSWWLYLDLDLHDIEIEWRQDDRFGLSHNCCRSEVVFGEGADAVVSSADEVVNWIREIQKSGAPKAVAHP